MRSYRQRRLIVEAVEPRRHLASDFLLTWAAGLIVGDFGGSRGGIFVSRADGTDMRQITVSQTNNYEFSGHGLNLPDDHPSFSPDGTKIAFTTSRYQQPGETNNFEIAVMNVDGTDVRRLTNSPGIDTEPVFSPDGSKIAFCSSRSGNLDIWVMNADGTNLVRLTTAVEAENEPAWNHAGTKIAYTKILDGGVFGIFDAEKDVYIMNADGSGKTLIAGLEAEEHDAVFSLDDTKLILSSEKDNTLPFGDTCVINIATKQYLSNLTIDDRTLRIGGGGDPTLSPDGTKIAYFKATGGPLLLAGPQKIHVMNANGSGKVKIDAPGIINVHPHFGRLADSDLDGKPDYADIDSPADFNEAMIQDEARVRAYLGNETIISNVGGIGLLAAKGYFPTHNFNSFSGMGVAFARDVNGNDPSVLGRPDVLLYAPNLAGGRDPTDAFGDYPYTLISWGYGTDYNPASVPTFAGFPEDAWLVHEAGFHNIVGGTFEATPPANDVPRGSKIATRPDEQHLTPWHERMWDIHFFTNPNGGTPKAAIRDPFNRNLPGFATEPVGFFYPQLPYQGRSRDGATVEAEDFDMAKNFGWSDTTAGNSGNAYRITDVDIVKTLDTDVGNDVVAIAAGECLQYTLDLPTSGTHDFAFRLSNGQSGGRFHIEVDGVNKSGSLAIPVTAGVKPDYATAMPFSTAMSAGRHRIKLVFETAPSGLGTSLRLNALSVTRRAAPSATMQNVRTIKTPLDTMLIHIDYADASGVDPTTLDGSDVRVVGPSGLNQLLTFVDATATTNSNVVTATYRLTPAGTGFDPSDNGAYFVLVNDGQVADATGQFVLSKILTSFTVAVPTFEVFDNHFQHEDQLLINGGESAESIVLTQVHNLITARRGTTVLGTVDVSDVDSIFVSGGGGDDEIVLTGVTLSATVQGNAGNDTMTGGSGIDTIRGGTGDDIARSTTLGPDVVNLDEQTGASPQGIVFQGTAGNDTIRVKRIVVEGESRVVFETSFGTFSHAIANCNTIIVNALGGNDHVVMEPSAGNNWRALFDGGTGRDVLIGSRRGDTLIGSDGDDWMDAGLGLDVLLGGRGNDRLIGGADADWIDGGIGNDTLTGGSGDDLLVGGSGIDCIVGGTGRDRARRDPLDEILEVEGTL